MSKPARQSPADAAAPPAAKTGAKPDGRVARSIRTRSKIAAAVLDLVSTGLLDPTAEAVAVHAGVGYRTVFRHFEDMEALFDEINAKIGELVLAGLPDLANGRVPDGPLAARIELFVTQRSQVFEAITNYYLSGNIRNHGSESLRRWRAGFAQLLRQQQARFIPESAASPETAALVELLATIDAWVRLRRMQQFDIETARRIVIHGVTALLLAEAN